MYNDKSICFQLHIITIRRSKVLLTRPHISVMTVRKNEPQSMGRSIYHGLPCPLPNTSSSPYFSFDAHYRVVHRHCRTSSASDARACYRRSAKIIAQLSLISKIKKTKMKKKKDDTSDINRVKKQLERSQQFAPFIINLFMTIAYCILIVLLYKYKI